jgi:hypothetical protein
MENKDNNLNSIAIQYNNKRLEEKIKKSIQVGFQNVQECIEHIK